MSFDPVSLKDIRPAELPRRVRRRGRHDRGPPRLADRRARGDERRGRQTGGWQTWTNVTVACSTTRRRARTGCSSCSASRPPTGRPVHNLNWFESIGKGAANTEAPEVSADADAADGRGAARGALHGTATDFDAEPATR